MSRNQVCDFVTDCPDGSDEAVSLCGNPQGFENGFDAWTRSGSVAYLFELNNGATPSGFTGPTADARNDSRGLFLSYFTLKIINFSKLLIQSIF